MSTAMPLASTAAVRCSASIRRNAAMARPRGRAPLRRPLSTPALPITVPDYERLIIGFYEAFQRGDAERMAGCYHPEASFSDPVFQLRGREIGEMWRMLCSGDNHLDVEFSDVEVDGDKGSAHWEARYRFGPRERTVHNRIDAEFRFDDGLILDHRDEFDLRAWAGQALGFPGRVFGGTKRMQAQIQARAASQLARYASRRQES